MELRTIAELLLNEGINVLPIKARSKAPLFPWGWLQQKLLPESELVHFDKSGPASGIAVICGTISENLLCIDIDAKGANTSHTQEVENMIARLQASAVWHTIRLDGEPIYLERSPSGGYHLIFRMADHPGGNRKLAMWPDGHVAVETRGEGGYVVVAPTPGYTPITGELVKLPILAQQQFDEIVAVLTAGLQNHKTHTPNTRQDAAPPNHAEYKTPDNLATGKLLRDHTRFMAELERRGWRVVEEAKITSDGKSERVIRYARPGGDLEVHATLFIEREIPTLYIFSTNAGLPTDVHLDCVAFIGISDYGSESWTKALDDIYGDYLSEHESFFRIFDRYYCTERISDDGLPAVVRYRVFQRQMLADAGIERKHIPKLDGFTSHPTLVGYRRVIDRRLNLIQPLPFATVDSTVRPEQIATSLRLVEHVFGEQYEDGLNYLQVLVTEPYLKLPILALVSREQGTGKTTFITWLETILGDNAARISHDDLMGNFNSHFARKILVTFDEAFFDRKLATERLKELTTATTIQYRQKFADAYTIPCHLHFIITSNDETSFTRIDRHEERYWVRVLTTISGRDFRIMDKLTREIPFFLRFLADRPRFTQEGRFTLDTSRLETEGLKKLKIESEPELAKELKLLIQEWFANNSVDELVATAGDIKERWFERDSRISRSYIMATIRAHLPHYEKSMMRYRQLLFESSNTRVGRVVFSFKRSDFLGENLQPGANLPPGMRDEMPF